MRTGGAIRREIARDAVIRPALPADLPDCGRIWRRALNDYMGRLNLPEIPDQLESIGRLHTHTLATDPERFVVAVDGDADGEGGSGRPAGRIVGFASACERGPLWYLSMLFVAPDAQGGGLGRRLLERVLPRLEDRARRPMALATDSAQPISNGLYASFGIVPRLPLYQLLGRPNRPDELPRLPPGFTLQEVAGGDLTIGEELPDRQWRGLDRTGERGVQSGGQPDRGPGGEPGSPSVLAEIGRLDRELLGGERPPDHRYALASGRRLFLCRDRAGTLAGYGYASPVGHVGPIAVHDAHLLPALTGRLLLAVEPRGASAIWLPGAAGATFTMLVQAGLRLDGFPVLLCWSRPFADFARYVPLSPGLL